MSMKKEIENLLNSESGRVRINNICFLIKYQSEICHKDFIRIEFDTINNIYFSVPFDNEIYSRDFYHIVEEIENKIEKYLRVVNINLQSQLRAGYRNKDKM